MADTRPPTNVISTAYTSGWFTADEGQYTWKCLFLIKTRNEKWDTQMSFDEYCGQYDFLQKELVLFTTTHAHKISQYAILQATHTKYQIPFLSRK